MKNQLKKKVSKKEKKEAEAMKEDASQVLAKENTNGEFQDKSLECQEQILTQEEIEKLEKLEKERKKKKQEEKKRKRKHKRKLKKIRQAEMDVESKNYSIPIYHFLEENSRKNLLKKYCFSFFLFSFF